ncbi:MAG: hypothetical protein OQL20_08560 [Sedimenticola sp.]|nr:hypothetical protein [Sedimenticola sp.]
MSSMSQDSEEFISAFNGSFTSALRWPQLDQLWSAVLAQAEEGWYIYAIGEVLPDRPVSVKDLERFVDEMDDFLHREHDETYCGIVYADDLKKPDFIKIYDPHNLGVSCGFSHNPPLPGWVLSKIVPCDIPSTRVLPNNRRRWWSRIFS